MRNGLDGRYEARVLTAKVSPAVVNDLVKAAGDGGFSELAQRYSANDGQYMVTGCSTMALTFLLGAGPKRVEAHGARDLAYDGLADMILFVDLWTRVQQLLPSRGA